MKKFILFALFIFSCYQIFADPLTKTDIISFNGKSYKLSFSDDFVGLELDATKWTQCKEKKRQNLNGWWKNDCSYVKDGQLVIECKRNEKGELSSGAISSREKFYQIQGLYEIKFMVTKASALWYAFWLECDGMSKHHEIPDSAKEGVEIDVFEILPGKNLFCTGIHYGGYEYYQNQLHTKSRQKKIDDSFYNVYHIVQFCWTDKEYSVYLDGKKLYSINVAKSGGLCEDPAYLILSAEFGKWGGEIDEKMTSSYMMIDYVNVYEEITDN